MTKNPPPNAVLPPGLKTLPLSLLSALLLLGLAMSPDAAAQAGDPTEATADRLTKLHNAGVTYILTQTDWKSKAAGNPFSPEAVDSLLTYINDYLSSTGQFTKAELQNQASLARDHLATFGPTLLAKSPDSATRTRGIEEFVAHL